MLIFYGQTICFLSFKSYDMNLSNKNNFHTPGSKRKDASVTTSEDNNRATIVSKAIFTAMSEEKKYTEDDQMKELVQRLGEYEQELYEKDQYIQLLENEIGRLQVPKSGWSEESE